MLELNDIHARYGAIIALRGVSIEVSKGELVALIGVNGAGKSTTLAMHRRRAATLAGEHHFRGELRSSASRPSRSPAWASPWCRKGATSSPA